MANNLFKTDHKQARNARVKTPTILQMEAVEGGAAALSIVLAYYGRYVTLEKLRDDCGVSRDGSKVYNILRAARRYGLFANENDTAFEELRSVVFPYIAIVNFNQYVVVEGFKNGVVFLNDPSCGPKKTPINEFERSFTGKILEFKPSPNFKKGGEKENLFRSLKNHLAGSRSALFYVTLAGLGLVFPVLIIPVFMKVFVDQIMVGNKIDWISSLLMGMVLTAFVFGALTWLQQHHLLRMESKISLSSSCRFFWHVLRLPVEFFSQRRAGEISSRVSLNDNVAQLLSGDLATTMIGIVMIIFYAIVLFQYDVILTLVGLFIALFNIAFLKYVSRARTDLFLNLLHESGQMQGKSTSGLQIIETIKATGSEDDFFADWADNQARLINVQQKFGLFTQLFSVVPPFLSAINTTIILVLGGYRIMDGYISIGMLYAFQTLMISFLAPINDVVNLGGKLQEIKGSLYRLDDVYRNRIDKYVDGNIHNGAEELSSTKKKLDGYLEIKNLTFGYNKLEAPLIVNFNLTLRPGDRIALVGGSGSGKSTLAKIITGLFKQWSGEALFDGKTRDQIPREVINNSVAMVDQDIFMFEGSVNDNITLWDETIPDSVVMQAAKDACIHDDIVSRPDGYNSKVDEGGANFSGGQRQRLEIARALVNDPTLLVLDEATSALDPKTEKIVDDNLRRRGCACLVVAHRLSTIRDCDEIIVLERGRIAQRGTHDEMSKVKGPYASLIEPELS